ncbi:hypothetical protein chiPu_0019719 [Chiloscyllium punctatum]|uniref:Uncharacterized protein n=1 Tax=Chiloscyllium punctatum TaxID=137246 RepID=A0A401RSY0_CHIPU|nr:hypothetical protein [Chiloscyllium punctatum]
MECRRRGARDRHRTAQPHCRRDLGRPAGGVGNEKGGGADRKPELKRRTRSCCGLTAGTWKAPAPAPRRAEGNPSPPGTSVSQILETIQADLLLAVLIPSSPLAHWDRPPLKLLPV